MKTIEDFRVELERFGLVTGQVIADGKIHRVTAVGKKREKVGWYVLHEMPSGFLAGAYGDWRFGGSSDWRSKDAWTEAERQEWTKKKAEIEAEQKRLYAQAAMEAKNTCAFLPKATDHPYLINKKIKPHNALIRGEELIIPAYRDGKISSYQRIFPDGGKYCFENGQMHGSYHIIGKGNPEILAEGYATGCSLHEATGRTVVIAWFANNLVNVAKQFPTLKVVAADDDQWTKGNPGLTEAGKTGLPIAKTDFPFTEEKGPTDFNDLACLNDLSAVAEILNQFLPKRPLLEAAPLREFDFASLPKRQWLYGTHLIRKFSSMTVAAAGTGKSTLAMLDAMSIASGEGIIGTYVHEQANTWVYNLEDPLEEMEKRFAAACIQYGKSYKDYAGRLFLNSGRDRDLIIMQKSGNYEYATPDKDGLIEAIRANNIGCLIVDPFVSCYEGDENSNKDIDKAIKAFNTVADETNCAIELIHHTGKQGAEAGNQNSGRGGSSMVGAVRVLRTLLPMSEQEANDYKIKPQERFEYVRCDGAKANMSKRTSGTRWLKLQGVYIGNGIEPGDDGDQVAVMVQWEPKGLFEGISTAKTDECLQFIEAGYNGNRYSFDPRSKSLYVAHAIAQCLNVDDDHAAQIMAIWRKNKRLYTKFYTNTDSKERSGIWVNFEAPKAE